MNGGVSQGTRLRVLVPGELEGGETCILPPAPMFVSVEKTKKKKKEKKVNVMETGRLFFFFFLSLIKFVHANSLCI